MQRASYPERLSRTCKVNITVKSGTVDRLRSSQYLQLQTSVDIIQFSLERGQLVISDLCL